MMKVCAVNDYVDDGINDNNDDDNDDAHGDGDVNDDDGSGDGDEEDDLARTVLTGGRMWCHSGSWSINVFYNNWNVLILQ